MISLHYSLEADCYDVKEAMIPDHHTNVDENLENIAWVKAVSKTVNGLLFEKKFIKIMVQKGNIQGISDAKSPVGNSWKIVSNIPGSKSSHSPMKSAH